MTAKEWLKVERNNKCIATLNKEFIKMVDGKIWMTQGPSMMKQTLTPS
jgi:hypothetical protein